MPLPLRSMPTASSVQTLGAGATGPPLPTIRALTKHATGTAPSGVFGLGSQRSPIPSSSLSSWLLGPMTIGGSVGVTPLVSWGQLSPAFRYRSASTSLTTPPGLISSLSQESGMRSPSESPS